MSNKTLATLKEECVKQREGYRSLKKQVETVPDSASCTEIVVRAMQSNQEGDEALDTLLGDISKPLVTSRVRKNQGIWGLQAADIDDVVQETLIRISRRLRKTSQPFEVTTFSKYIAYLFMTARSVAINYLEKLNLIQNHEESLDQPSFAEEDGDKHEQTGKADKDVGAFEAKTILDKVLSNCLPDSLERRIVIMRFAYEDTPDDIAEFLRHTHPDIDKKRVYRILENVMKKLHRCGEFKALAAENFPDAGL